MCGFIFTNGFLFTKEQSRGLLEIIKYRGPDHNGYIRLSNSFLFHARLSILDHGNESANQPLFSKNGRYAIIYNGEIYNYKELAKRYDITLSTQCDTELLLELYLKIKEKILNEINGMFSFVIFDTKTEEIFAARDRLGVKPLYFFKKNEKLIFSSELSAIRHITDISDFDEIGLRQYRCLRTTFVTKTIFKDISFFPPGHYYKNGEFVKYWDVDFECNNNNPDIFYVKNLIKDAVKIRLISDRAVGTYLSGGLDSTVVTQLARMESTSNINSFTIGFPDDNEFSFSKVASQHIGTTHEEVIIDDKEFIDISKKMIFSRRDVLSVPNEVLIYKMTKVAKKIGVHVLLSGEGADEIFFGYDRIFNWANENPKFNIMEFSALYSYGASPDLEIIDYTLQPFLKKYNTSIQIVAAFFQKYHLHGLLRRLDFSSMYAGVEARPVFTDYRIVEYFAKLSFNARTSKTNNKKLLKDIFCDIIPKEVLDRKKVGFPVDIDAILTDSFGKGSYEKWINFNLRNLI